MQQQEMRESDMEMQSASCRGARAEPERAEGGRRWAEQAGGSAGGAWQVGLGGSLL